MTEKVFPIQTKTNHFVMPGLATAHSHSFQRVLRGRTQRRSTAADTFWSWRGLMYRLVELLRPEDLYDVSRLAYAELAMSGVTAVGEFHYLHHDFGGQPYANRTETAETVVQAALDVGVRICLIRTAYLRAGYEQSLHPAQARFVDADVEQVLQDVQILQQRYAGNPMVSVALAAHSIRAVPLEQIKLLAEYADRAAMPFHMHVCEQRRELEESLAEYGMTPIELLDRHGLLSERFVGVHATHLSAAEVQALGSAGAQICVCRTTERDLGDGLPPVSALLQAGAGLTVGVDSHCAENAFEEIRAVELDERSRLEARQAAAQAPKLLDAATRQGYRACNLLAAWNEDRVWLRRQDPALLGIDEKHAADGIVFAATPRAVEKVEVAGTTIVDGAGHRDYEAISRAYLRCLQDLEL